MMGPRGGHILNSASQDHTTLSAAHAIDPFEKIQFFFDNGRRIGRRFRKQGLEVLSWCEPGAMLPTEIGSGVASEIEPLPLASIRFAEG